MDNQLPATPATPSAPESKLSLPVSIVVAGILIAGAIFLSRGGGSPTAPGTGAETDTRITVAAITPEDHFIGNPKAPATFIEFSDLECPYCKSFHATMRTLMDEYGKDGKLAWVFRHFPLAQLHPKAVREAEAVECVDELSNGTATWKFIDRIFEITPANNRLEETDMLAAAEAFGVKKADLTTCLDSGRQKAAVEADLQDAVTAGGRGTPFTVILLADKLSNDDAQAISTLSTTMLGRSDIIVVDSTRKTLSMSGALPIAFMREFLNILTK